MMLALAFSCGIVVSMFRALALTILWKWFVVPFGVPALSFWIALGILYTYNLIDGPTWADLEDHTAEDGLKMCLACIIQVIISLGLGWSIHLVSTT